MTKGKERKEENKNMGKGKRRKCVDKKKKKKEVMRKEKENNSKKLGVNELNYSETTNT